MRKQNFRNLTLYNMKKRLQNLLDLNIDLDQFYCVDITEQCTRLQGKANWRTKAEAEKLEIKLTYDNKYGWIEGDKDGIHLCLTLA